MNAQQLMLKDRLIKRATEEYAHLPQWKGHFADWKLARIMRGIKFASGASFKIGEYTIAAPVTVDLQGEPYYELLTQFPANVVMRELLTTGIGPVPARGNFIEFVE